MANRVVLTDGDEPERAERRHLLFSRQGIEIERSSDDRVLFRSFLEPAVPGERHLLFVHMSAWPRTEPPVSQWHPSRRRTVSVLLYSFGNWLTADYDGVADYEASLDHVYLLERPIKSDFDEKDFALLASFVAAWRKDTPAPELADLFAQLHVPLQLDVLPALSLLSQTYLAAHDRIKLENVVIPPDAAETTERAEWWMNVLGEHRGFVNAMLREVAAVTQTAPSATLPKELKTFTWTIYEANGHVKVPQVEQVMKYLNGIFPAS